MKSNKKRILFVLAILTMALVLSCALVACTKADTPDAPKKEFTITFDTQGGSEVKPITIAEGATITLPRNPTKEGYIFDGWYLSDEFIEKFNATQTISSNITVYAKWKEDGGNQDEKQSYTITFDTQGGSEVKSLVLKEGETLTLPSNPTKEGSVFDGWYLDSSYTQAFDSTKRIDSNMVLYAKWKILDDGQSIIASDYFDINGLVLTMNKQKYITSSEDVFDLRNKFSTSNGSSWRAFTSPNCDQPTEITTRTANVSAGWNNIYVMVENLTTYENQIYRLKIYKYPTIVYKALEEGFWEIQSVSDCADVLFPDDKIDNITSIGEHAFSSCPSLRTLQKLPKLTSIGPSAFANCKRLTSITIPGSVTSIGNSAFSGCTGLTSITIPNSVTSIGEGAFKGCNNLTSMTLPFIGASVTAHSGYDEVFGYIFGYTTRDYSSASVSGATYQYYGNSKYYHYYIPSSITSVTITGRTIPYRAFYNCTGLTSVTIPDSVTSIGEYAFSGCNNLSSIYYVGDVAGWCRISGLNNIMSDSRTLYIGGKKIEGALIIPDGVMSIGRDAFAYCTGLTSVTIGNGVTNIGSQSFYGCTGLTSITIPDSVTSIGARAFSYCTGLTSVTIGNNVTSIVAQTFETCTSLTSVTIGNGVTSIGESAFSGCTRLTSITIPDSVTSIGNWAFYNCSSLTSITIPDSVTSIGDSAFYKCTGLTSITIPDSVTYVGDSAFYNCTGLTSITIPDSVTYIGGSAFSGCSSLENITIPFVGVKAGVTSSNKYQYPFGYIFGTNSYTGGVATKQYYYGDSTYSTTSTTYYIPSSLKSVTVTGGNILFGAFYNCTGLTILTLGNSVTSIGNSAFYNCTGLTSVTIGNSVTSIGKGTFYGCSGLTSVTIGNGVKSIDKNAFTGCNNLQDIYITDIAAWCNISGLDNLMDYGSSNKKLYINNELVTSVTIPDGVTIVLSSAFRGCSSLTSVTIPDSVTSIGSYAFRNCSKLQNIYITDIAAWCNISGLDNLMDYGSSNKKLYINNELATSITIPNGVKTIPSYAFRGCTGLMSITIPESVTSIGNYAFRGCTGLMSITIPESVTSIGNYAFDGCSGLTNVTIPESVTSIGNYAFDGCSGLTSVTIPDSVTSIGNYAFHNCSSLTSVTIPDGVTIIPSSAFRGCSNLTSVTIGNNVTSIGIDAFRDCTGLTSITIPDSVTSIGDSAFSGCNNLQNIYITDIAAWCNISGLSNLMKYGSSNKKLYINNELATSIILPNGVTTIPSNAFSGCTGLTNVTIPDSVTSIGSSAFHGCSSLESITIPFVGAKAGVTSSDTYQYPLGYIFGTSSYTGGIATTQYYYGNSTSSTTSTTYYIPSSLKSVTVTGGNILYGAFYNCTGLTSVTIGNSVTSIGNSAFEYCTGLTSVTIPDSVKSIGESAFSSCSSLESITIPFVGAKAGVTSSDTYQYPLGYIFGTSSYTGGIATTQYYYGNSTSSTTSTTYYIPSSLKSVTVTGGNILYGAFYDCTGLTSITIPDSVTSIGERAFYDCTGLTSVTIPNSVTSIGESAFGGCYRLVEVYNKSSLKITAGSSSNGYVAYYAKNVYTNEGGSKLTTDENGYVIYTDGDEKILVAYHGTNTELILPSDITKINQKAFRGCTELTSITIPDSVTSIGENAFSGCSGLTSITIPNSVTSIGSSAFSGCNNLQNIYITDIAAWCNISGLYYLMEYGASNKKLYINNELVTSITIQDGVTAIPFSAFRGCTGLTSITISDSVTSIGASAFSGCTGLTSITIPNSVTSIGDGAFSGCNNLQNIYITDIAAWCNISGLDNLMDYGSSNKKLYINNELATSITIPNGVTAIPSSAFRGCSRLTSITIPNSVTSIGASAFRGCTGLTSITIPDSVKSIGSAAFSGCSSLESITIPFVGAKAGVTSSDTYQYPFGYIFGTSSYTGGVATPQYYYVDSTFGTTNTTYYIPSSLKSVTVTGGNIFSRAFYNCTGLTSITIPDSVTSIDYEAFYHCTGLTSITIPDSVKSIGKYAFEGCTGLTSITIPNSVTSIGSSAFRGCSGLTSVTIPDSVKSIDHGTFEYCTGLMSITIPNSVKSIGDGAFRDCYKLIEVYNKSSLKITAGSSSNGYVAYYARNVYTSEGGSKLTEDENGYVVYTDGNIKILVAYLGTNTELILPSYITGINQYAFYNCTELTSIIVVKGNSKYHSAGNCLIETATKTLILGCNTSVIPTDGSVTSIGERAFRNCTGLTSITIPNSVTSIGASAFSGCSSLENITIPFVGANAGVTSSDNFQYPFGYIFGTSSYIGGVATPQSYYVDSTSSATSTTYYIPSSLKSVTVTGGNILRGAFYNCSGLTSVTIGNGVTNIGSQSFYGCTGLTSITIPDSVKSIGYGAFSGCSSLESITIPFVGAKAGVTSGDTYQYPFGYIFGTSSYTGGVATPQSSSTSSTTYDTYYIPSSLKTVTVTGGNILDGAFYNCSGLTSITIPDSVTSIGSNAFMYCSGLTSITIPDSVTSIGERAFFRCRGLTSVTIPGSVTSIGSSAFSDCSGLTSVTIPDSVKSIGYGTFEFCTGLTSITIGSGVTSIGDYAFSGCSGLTSITFNGTKAQWNAISKGNNWKRSVPATQVVCTDGTISIY